MDKIGPKIELMPTVPRQTPQSEFANSFREALRRGGAATAQLASVLPGGSVIATAIGSITSLGDVDANLNGGKSAIGTSAPNGSAGPLSGELAQMKQQADESLAMQIALQNESREYSTLSNVIKVRHDSAKAAINNIH